MGSLQPVQALVMTAIHVMQPVAISVLQRLVAVLQRLWLVPAISVLQRLVKVTRVRSAGLGLLRRIVP